MHSNCSAHVLSWRRPTCSSRLPANCSGSMRSHKLCVRTNLAFFGLFFSSLLGQAGIPCISLRLHKTVIPVARVFLAPHAHHMRTRFYAIGGALNSVFFGFFLFPSTSPSPAFVCRQTTAFEHVQCRSWKRWQTLEGIQFRGDTVGAANIC